MNFQDFRNLQEAYIGVYDEGYKDLPRLRMAGQALKKARRGFEGARTAINSGETKDTSGGQIASKKSIKDVTQAQKIINKSLPGGHSKEKAQTKEKFNKSVGEFAKKDPELAASIRKKMNKESYNLYDIILSHLLDEGYADTQEAALAIMGNMSEEWRESICEGYKPLPEKGMRRKTEKLKNEIEGSRSSALKTPVGSKERQKILNLLSRKDDIERELGDT